MPTSTSTARWEGKIGDGSGQMTIGAGVWTGSYNVPTRFEGAEGVNPEQLIGAAHAGCFSMALSAALSRAGHDVKSVDTSADVTIEKGGDGWEIVKITLTTIAEVPGLEASEFQDAAEGAKRDCPVSKALAGVGTIELNATLKN